MTTTENLTVAVIFIIYLTKAGITTALVERSRLIQTYQGGCIALPASVNPY